MYVNGQPVSSRISHKIRCRHQGLLGNPFANPAPVALKREALTLPPSGVHSEIYEVPSGLGDRPRIGPAMPVSASPEGRPAHPCPPLRPWPRPPPRSRSRGAPAEIPKFPATESWPPHCKPPRPVRTRPNCPARLRCWRRSVRPPSFPRPKGSSPVPPASLPRRSSTDSATEIRPFFAHPIKPDFGCTSRRALANAAVCRMDPSPATPPQASACAAWAAARRPSRPNRRAPGDSSINRFLHTATRASSPARLFTSPGSSFRSNRYSRPPSRNHIYLYRPSVRQWWRRGFRADFPVEYPVADRVPAVQRRKKRHPVRLPGDGAARRRDQRGQHVDERHGLLIPLRRNRALPASRRPENQWNATGTFEKMGFEEKSVVSHHVAVVRGKDHQRVVPQPLPPERGQKPPDLMVDMRVICPR